MRRSGLLSGFATPKMLDMLGSLVLGIGMMQQLCSAGVAATAWGRGGLEERCPSSAAMRLYARTTRATTPEMLFERMAEGRHRKACWRSLIEVFGMYAGVVQECFYRRSSSLFLSCCCAVKLQSTPIVSQTGRSHARSPSAVTPYCSQALTRTESSSVASFVEAKAQAKSHRAARWARSHPRPRKMWSRVVV